jgi:hypothetical protein
VIRGFQTAAAEMWMLGLTDYQIITTHSGYGRLGSFMSGKFHQVRPLAPTSPRLLQPFPPPARLVYSYIRAAAQRGSPLGSGSDSLVGEQAIRR